MDPQMEALLFEWCVDQIIRNKKPVSRSLIKQQAKNFSRNKELFKASKGWLDKFMKRFNYSEKTKEILSNFRDQTKFKKLENNNYSPSIPKGNTNNFIKIEPFFSVENSPIKKEFKNEDQGFY